MVYHQLANMWFLCLVVEMPAQEPHIPRGKQKHQQGTMVYQVQHQQGGPALLCYKATWKQPEDKGTGPIESIWIHVDRGSPYSMPPWGPEQWTAGRNWP